MENKIPAAKNTPYSFKNIHTVSVQIRFVPTPNMDFMYFPAAIRSGERKIVQPRFTMNMV